MDEALTSVIPIDAAGDIKLLVEHGQGWTTFQVSSKAMSLASPVWRTMLDPNGPFRESKSDDNEIAFPDDDSKALLILLLAAHLRYQEVPQELRLEQLLNVCILCDKYDCITLVRPWISRWLDAGENLYEEWLFIAWTTGEEATFESTGRRLILRANTNESGTFNDTRLSKLHLPPGSVEGMRDARLQTITKLIELTHSLVDRRAPYGQSLHCEGYKEGFRNKPDREACDDLSNGSLVRQLRANSLPVALWPGCPAEIASLYPGSIEDLRRVLLNMECKIYPGGWHQYCGFTPKLKDGVEKILAEMPSGMNDSHRRHMAAQRSKLTQSHLLLGQLGLPQPSSEEKSRWILEIF